MAQSPSRIASAMARRIQAAGLNAEIVASRESRSHYVYVSIHEDDLDTVGDRDPECGGFYIVRISDHLNPALRRFRVSGTDDRATEAHIEIRTDSGEGADWRDRADAIIARYAAALAAIKEAA